PPLEEYLQDLKTVLVQGLQIETMMLAPPAGPEPAPADPAP
ncbi:TIGR03899 family protein, partial [Aeromonas hydrophila]